MSSPEKGIHYFTHTDTVKHYIVDPTNFIPKINFAINDKHGNVVLNWDTLNIDTNYFSSYHIFRDTVPTGLFTLLDTIPNHKVNAYFDSNAGADTSSLYYYVKANVLSPCLGTYTLSKRSKHSIIILPLFSRFLKRSSTDKLGTIL